MTLHSKLTMLSDGIGPYLEREHYYADDFVSKLIKYPRSRIAFITIRCPKQTKPWNKIGKSGDWIRRYSECYYIVRGTAGGDHFHLLAGIRPGVVMRYKKGIHFNVKCLNGDLSPLKGPEDWDELRISKEKTLFYHRQQVEIQMSDLNEKESSLVQAIALMIQKYWRSKYVKAKRITKQTDIEKNVCRIIRYMEKNLLEPREDSEIELYRDYMYK